MTSFAQLICASSTNLGDEIQSIAARRFLPRVDRFIDRERLDHDPGEPVAAILNGWFMHHPRRWPPHRRLVPLITSFHLATARSRRAPWRRSAASVLLCPAGTDYLKRHGPIGARDPATLALLRARGIDAYLSGCLTLTLERDPTLPRDGGVVACDLEPAALAALRRRTDRPVAVTRHEDDRIEGADARLAAAADLLDLYARATCVVTTRLHCALPCLALGTPVLFMTRKPEGRIEPAMQLTHSCAPDDFIAGRDGYDFASPPANPTAFTEFRELLIDRCSTAPQLRP